MYGRNFSKKYYFNIKKIAQKNCQKKNMKSEINCANQFFKRSDEKQLAFVSKSVRLRNMVE